MPFIIDYNIDHNVFFVCAFGWRLSVHDSEKSAEEHIALLARFNEG